MVLYIFYEIKYGFIYFIQTGRSEFWAICPCEKPLKSTVRKHSMDFSWSFQQPLVPSNQSLGSLFKTPAGSWECPTCMIQNKADVAKCVACETTRPKANNIQVAASPSIEVRFSGLLRRFRYSYRICHLAAKKILLNDLDLSW